MLVLTLFILSAIATLLCIFKLKYPLEWASVIDGIKYNILGTVLYVAFSASDAFFSSQNVLKNLQNRKDHVAIVTGGGRGLGQSIAEGLMENGMTVVIGARRPESCEELLQSLTKKYPQGKVSAMKLDTSSMKSVKEFCKQFMLQYSKLNILVNNAGILTGEFKSTEDGFEEKLATNYLGHFLLTHLLTDSMKMGGFQDELYSRVVNVTSGGHIIGNIEWNDINLKSNYHYAKSYCQSKLAQLMFSHRLNKSLEYYGVPVRSYAVNPGVVGSDMFKSVLAGLGSWALVLNKLVRTPQRGAVPVLFACLSPTLENKGGGSYVSNCAEGYSTAFSKSSMDQDRLFKQTMTMLGIDMFGVPVGYYNLGRSSTYLQNENKRSL